MREVEGIEDLFHYYQITCDKVPCVSCRRNTLKLGLEKSFWERKRIKERYDELRTLYVQPYDRVDGSEGYTVDPVDHALNLLVQMYVLKAHLDYHLEEKVHVLELVKKKIITPPQTVTYI